MGKYKIMKVMCIRERKQGCREMELRWIGMLRMTVDIRSLGNHEG